MSLQTVTTTVSSANQTAVPSPVRHLLDLQPKDRLLWQVNTRTKIVKIKRTPRRWGSYMAGLGREVWQNTRADQYLRDLRADRNGQNGRSN